MKKKLYEVGVEVIETSVKRTVATVEATSTVKAKGAAEYVVEQNPDLFEFFESTPTIKVTKSTFVKQIEDRELKG